MFPKPLPGWKCEIQEISEPKLNEAHLLIWKIAVVHKRVFETKFSRQEINDYRNEVLRPRKETMCDAPVRIQPEFMNIDFVSGTMKWSAEVVEI